MSKYEYYKNLSKENLLIILNNVLYENDRLKDKLLFLTGCACFGDSDGMNGSCVDCSYNTPIDNERCCDFGHAFHEFYLKRCNERKEQEKEEKVDMWERF